MFVLRSKYFGTGPSIRRSGEHIWITTHPLVRLLSMFSYVRRVHVDGSAGYVFLTERKFWLSRSSRTIPFKHVAGVRYTHGEVPTSWNIRGAIHDTVETFSIGLQLHDSGEVVSVARFSGEGSAGDAGTLLLGDDLLDFEGTQDSESRALVENLLEVIGVELSGSRSPAVPLGGLRWACLDCGRPVPPQPKCLYCGGPVAKAE